MSPEGNTGLQVCGVGKERNKDNKMIGIVLLTCKITFLIVERCRHPRRRLVFHIADIYILLILLYTNVNISRHPYLHKKQKLLTGKWSAEK